MTRSNFQYTADGWLRNPTLAELHSQLLGLPDDETPLPEYPIRAWDSPRVAEYGAIGSLIEGKL